MALAGRLHCRSAAAEEVPANKADGDDNGALQRSRSSERSAVTALTAMDEVGELDALYYLGGMKHEAPEVPSWEHSPLFAYQSTFQQPHATSNRADSAAVRATISVAETWQPQSDPAVQALPRWAVHLVVPHDEHIAALCAAFVDWRRWRVRMPAGGAASSTSGGSESSTAEHFGLSASAVMEWKRVLDEWDGTDRITWRESVQLARCGEDVVLFEGVRAVPSIMLFLTLQDEQETFQHQRNAGGGRYKRLMDSIGIAPCDCVEAQMANARVNGWTEHKIAELRLSCTTSCHRYRLQTAWATRVNRGGKVVDNSKVAKGGAAGWSSVHLMKREQPQAAAAGARLASVAQHLAPYSGLADGPAGGAALFSSPFQLQHAQQGEDTQLGSLDELLGDLPMHMWLTPGDLNEATLEGDTPRFAPKRPKRESPAAYWQQDLGHGQRASHAHPQASNPAELLGHGVMPEHVPLSMNEDEHASAATHGGDRKEAKHQDMLKGVVQPTSAEPADVTPEDRCVGIAQSVVLAMRLADKLPGIQQLCHVDDTQMQTLKNTTASLLTVTDDYLQALAEVSATGDETSQSGSDAGELNAATADATAEQTWGDGDGADWAGIEAATQRWAANAGAELRAWIAAVSPSPDADSTHSAHGAALTAHLRAIAAPADIHDCHQDVKLVTDGMRGRHGTAKFVAYAAVLFSELRDALSEQSELQGEDFPSVEAPESCAVGLQASLLPANQVSSPVVHQNHAIAARSMVLVSCLLDQLPALRLSCCNGSDLSSALAAFMTRLQEATSGCLAALPEAFDSALQTALADASSDDEDAAQTACRGPADVGATPADALDPAVWQIVADALQAWTSGVELALTAWAAAIGITGCSGDGRSVLLEILAELSEGDAALQQPDDADTDGDEDGLILERLVTAKGRSQFVPYALALLNELLDSASDEVECLPSKARSLADASQPSRGSLAAVLTPRTCAGGEQLPNSSAGEARHGLQSRSTGTPRGFCHEGSTLSPPGGGDSNGGDVEIEDFQTLADGAHDWQEATVFFATNRDTDYRFGAVSNLGFDEDDEGYKVFGSRRGHLQYGSVRAKYLPCTIVTSGHPWARHVRLDNLCCAGDDPPSALCDFLQRKPGNGDSTVLIYVHGFNTKFEAALARAAQFSMATRFCGPVLAFSWPSAGSWRPTRYFMDGHQALKSNQTFGRVLKDLADAGCKRVAIIAHSMGNRILTAALDGVRDAEATTQLLRTATLVFAAADVGRRDFVRVLKTTAARPADKRLRTVYRSNCDRALALSTFINATGRVGCRLLLEDEFETIDASQSSGRDITKHGYWAQSKAVVADLRGLIILGRAAPERVLRVDNADGTLKHCSCHPMTATRRHYVIYRP